MRADEVRAQTGHRRRALHAADRAGWVYWEGAGDFAELTLTDAGRAAVERAKAARRARLAARPRPRA